MRRAAPCHAAVNSRNVAGMMIVSLSILAMALAFAGVIIGFRQPPASTFGAAILPAVWLPYALVLWWSYRRQAARAAALAGGTALVAFLSLALFAGVLTLLLGLAMGNQDQVNFVLLLDAFVLLQLPLAVAGWRAWRRVPAAERPGGCWTVGLGLPLLVAAGVAILGLLMVSSIPYRNFKEIDLRHSYRAIVVMVLVLALIVQEPQISIFAIGVLYVLSGPIEWVWRRVTDNPLEKLPSPPAPEAPQETPS